MTGVELVQPCLGTVIFPCTVTRSPAAGAVLLTPFPNRTRASVSVKVCDPFGALWFARVMSTTSVPLK